MPAVPLTGTRQSSRRATPSQKLQGIENTRLKKALGLITFCFTGMSGTVGQSYMSIKKELNNKLKSYQSKMINYKEVVDLNADGSLNCMHLLSFVANMANDTFHFHQAMQEDDCDEVINAMIKELKDHKELWRGSSWSCASGKRFPEKKLCNVVT